MSRIPTLRASEQPDTWGRAFTWLLELVGLIIFAVFAGFLFSRL
jgi:hypothetical protein